MKNSKQPLVSVIMPVYNAEKYISFAIESVINQSYKNWELIIVDDCSTDKSWEIISRYQKKYPKKIITKKLRKNRNSGGDWAGNEAYYLSSGKYIARMDADDVMHPERLIKQVKFMEKNKNIAVLGTCAHIIDSKGEITGKKMQPAKNRDIYRQYIINHPMINPSVMFRRSLLLDKKELYKIKYAHNNDLYSFLKMITNGRKFANLQEKLVYYRVHGNNDSLRNFKKCFWNTFKIRMIAIKELGYKPTLRAVVMNMMQIGAAVVLPEKAIKFLYLVSRGMLKPSLRLEKKEGNNHGFIFGYKLKLCFI